MLWCTTPEAKPRFSVLVIPNNCCCCPDGKFALGQKNNDLEFLASLKCGWSLQCNPGAAYVDARASDIRRRFGLYY